MLRILLLVVVAVLTNSATAHANNQPRIVVSIKPLQLIAAAVLGEGEPPAALLLDPRRSHHDYQLRPSERLLLGRADIVFWIGPELEGFLRQPLAALPATVRVVALGEPDATEHETADHGGGEPHDGGETGGHNELHAHAHDRDAHYWLSPVHAVRMAFGMAEALALAAPERASEWRANARRFEGEVATLDARLALRLAAAAPTARPYLAMHDAYGHFERRYGLQRAATYTATPEQQPGARHMGRLREQLARGEIRCVLRETQMRAGPLDAALANHPDVRLIDLDLLGAAVAPSPDGYLVFLERFAEQMLRCVAA